MIFILKAILTNSIDHLSLILTMDKRNGVECGGRKNILGAQHTPTARFLHVLMQLFHELRDLCKNIQSSSSALSGS